MRDSDFESGDGRQRENDFVPAKLKKQNKKTWPPVFNCFFFSVQKLQRDPSKHGLKFS